MTLGYWCVLIAALLAYAFAGIAKWGPGFDNARPRVYLDSVSGYRQRAHWAQLNSFEMLPVFVAAVLIAHQVGAPQDRIDLLALCYVIARALYGVAYLADWATARSLVWGGALACVIGLFLAGA